MNQAASDDALCRKLEQIIGYTFRTPQLLTEALTHSSYAQEMPVRGRDNEQLEFLGDAVLNFVVSIFLVEAFPDCEEGKLSRARSRLVAESHLVKVAEHLDLGRYLRLGRGETKTGGRKKAALLADAVEAMVAALYRDGGVQAARDFVQRFVLPPDLREAGAYLFAVDYKSALQEYLQGHGRGAATYRVVEETGPEHQKTFVVEVTTLDGVTTRGRGRTKKAAEQRAAEQMLASLGVKSEVHD